MIEIEKKKKHHKIEINVFSRNVSEWFDQNIVQPKTWNFCQIDQFNQHFEKINYKKKIEKKKSINDFNQLKKISYFFWFKNENSKNEILMIKFNIMKIFRSQSYVFWKNVMKESLDFSYCMNNINRMWFNESEKEIDDRKLIIEWSFFIWKKFFFYSNFMHQSNNLFHHQYHVIFMHFLGVVSYIA